MIKYFCDNCNKELKEKECFEIRIHFKAIENMTVTSAIKDKYKNYTKIYCDNCHALFIERIEDTF